MRFLLGLALVVGIVGFVRGWFELSGNRDTPKGKVKVELTVDPEKVEEDAEKTKEFADKVVDDAKEGIERALPAEKSSPN